MSNDDLTHNLSASNEDDKATQPTITAVFRLLQDLDKRFNARFEALENRLDQLETRLSRDFAGVDARFVEMSNEMKNGFTKLSDKVADQMDQTRVHHDADYQDLLRRMRRLESEAS